MGCLLLLLMFNAIVYIRWGDCSILLILKILHDLNIQ